MADEKEIKVRIVGDIQDFQKAASQVEKINQKIAKSAKAGGKPGFMGGFAKGFSKAGLPQSIKKLSKEFGKFEKSKQASFKTTTSLVEKQNKTLSKNVALLEAQAKAAKKTASALKAAETGGGAGTPATGGGPGGNGSGGSRSAILGGMLGGVIGGAIVSALTKAVGFIVGSVTSQMRSSYAAYTNFERARAGLSGMGRVQGTFVTGQKGQYGVTGVFKKAEDLGFSATETVQQMRSIGRQTGNINSVNLAQRAARSFGGDVTEVGNFMGLLTRAGHGFGGSMGTSGRQGLVKVLGDAVAAGLDKSRTAEHLGAVSQAVYSAQSVTAGKVNVSAISGLLTVLSRTKQPGLMGQAGYNVLANIDQGVKSAGFGGGNDAVTASIYQALGFGTPTGTADFYNVTKQAQQGVFGESGAKTLDKVFDYYAKMGGGPNSEVTNLRLSRAFQLSLDQVESIWKARESGATGDDLYSQIAEITRKSKSVDEQILQVNEEQLRLAKRSASLENRLIAIGEKLAPATEKFQDAVNTLVEKFVPAAVGLMGVLADLATSLSNLDVTMTKIASDISEWLNESELGRSAVEGAIDTVVKAPGVGKVAVEAFTRTSKDAAAQLEAEAAAKINRHPAQEPSPPPPPPPPPPTPPPDEATGPLSMSVPGQNYSHPMGPVLPHVDSGTMRVGYGPGSNVPNGEGPAV